MERVLNCNVVSVWAQTIYEEYVCRLAVLRAANCTVEKDYDYHNDRYQYHQNFVYDYKLRKDTFEISEQFVSNYLIMSGIFYLAIFVTRCLRTPK